MGEDERNIILLLLFEQENFVCFELFTHSPTMKTLCLYISEGLISSIYFTRLPAGLKWRKGYRLFK